MVSLCILSFAAVIAYIFFPSQPSYGLLMHDSKLDDDGRVAKLKLKCFLGVS